jgi:hypothetical protein
MRMIRPATGYTSTDKPYVEFAKSYKKVPDVQVANGHLRRMWVARRPAAGAWSPAACCLLPAAGLACLLPGVAAPPQAHARGRLPRL